MLKENINLIQKYNIPGPRYTSYPTVPYWDNNINTEVWKKLVKEAFGLSNSEQSISIYIHLPFCESLCTYCGCNTRITVNHKVEEPYIKALIKEWKMYLRLFDELPFIKEIHLGGGTPTFFSPQNLKELINAIKTSSVIDSKSHLSFEAHPKNTSAEHLKTLFELGFKRLSLGIQDFEPDVQKAINRIQSYGMVEQSTKDARNIGYESINYDLIYGLPFQTVKSIRKTINKVIKLKPDRIAFYSYAHVPWMKPGQRSYGESDLPKDEEKRTLYETGKKMLEAAGYQEIGMDHFALNTDELWRAMKRKKLHRNFMGYTEDKTNLLIGLGVSSISDSWTGFAQNVKTVEHYYELIEKDILPIFRGHILTSEDLVLRDHILNIMCKHETEWGKKKLQCKALFEGLERLREMEDDELVSIESEHLQVTEKGLAFIRNICMAFDARLWRKIPQTNLFSSTI